MNINQMIVTKIDAIVKELRVWRQNRFAKALDTRSLDLAIETLCDCRSVINDYRKAKMIMESSLEKVREECKEDTQIRAAVVTCRLKFMDRMRSSYAREQWYIARNDLAILIDKYIENHNMNKRCDGLFLGYRCLMERNHLGAHKAYPRKGEIEGILEW